MTDAALAAVERALFGVARTVWRLRSPAPGDSNVDRSGMAVLDVLADAGDVRPSDLAPAVGVDLSTLSRHLRLLDAAGLVDRVPDAVDGRAHRLHVTQTGRQALDRMHCARRELLARALHGWNAADRERLAELLARLADDLCPHATTRTEPATAVEETV